MSLHLTHCRETRPSFESGHLGVHCTWGIKHRVPLTYLFLREGSSWGACGKLAYLFSRSQVIILIPRWYGVQETFLKVLYWNWWSSIHEMVVSGNLSGSQKESSHLLCMMWIVGWLCSQCKGNWHQLNLILGTLSNFAFLGWHHCSFSIWHSNIGIPNYIKKLSGIVNIWSSEHHVAFELSKWC